MINLNFILWLFPVLFILHDSEELLFMEKWVKKNYKQILKNMPSFVNRLIPDFSCINAKSFAFGAAEELLIIIIVTVFAFKTSWHYLWIGLFIAFTMHLFIHIVQALFIRRYIPSLATSIACLPFCVFFIIKMATIMKFNQVLFYSVVGLLFMILNLTFIHYLMKRLFK